MWETLSPNAYSPYAKAWEDLKGIIYGYLDCISQGEAISHFKYFQAAQRADIL